MKSMRKVQKGSGLILGGSGWPSAQCGTAESEHREIRRALRARPLPKLLMRQLISEALAILHQSRTKASLVREALRAHRFVGLKKQLKIGRLNEERNRFCFRRSHSDDR